LWQTTGQKSAFIYVTSRDRSLDIVTVFPDRSLSQSLVSSRVSDPEILTNIFTKNRQNQFTRKAIVPDVDRQNLLADVTKFRLQILSPQYRTSQQYLPLSKKLYQLLIAPIEDRLKVENIQNLVFSMDSGLRYLPLAVLHDGEQFLIEKYGVSLVPSFGLTDITYVDIRDRPVLAMGSAKFEGLPALPGVPLEVTNILEIPWMGESFINEQFTLDNFKQQAASQNFGVIHLATHAEFKPGRLENSYIQFFEDKLNLVQFRQLAQELGWTSVENPPIELLVLSACRTALGEEQAELGFAGLAVLSGVKSVLGSLWYVSDAATLGLMSEFYHHLRETPIKVQALRESQLALLRGKVEVKDGLLYLSTGETLTLPPELAQFAGMNFSHPYYWSAFTLVGNWN
jgi:CHAT domain-containing protein